MRDDLRDAVRSLRSNRGFTIAALIVLTLSIAATTAIFSVVDAVVLRGLPFDEPQALVSLRHYANFGETSQGPATYFTYRENQQSFEDIGAWDSTTVAITGYGPIGAMAAAIAHHERAGRIYVIDVSQQAIAQAEKWRRDKKADNVTVLHTGAAEAVPASVIRPCSPPA